MERITSRDLERLVESINALAKTDTYELSGAYGGYQLHQIVNKNGGARTLLSDGHVPKRELHGLMRAYISGYTASEFARVEMVREGWAMLRDHDDLQRHIR